MSDWPSIRDELKSSSVTVRLKGLSNLLGDSNQNLSMEEFAEFVDLSAVLLTDINFKVAQQTLHCLSMLVCKEPEAIRPYANSIIPLVAERLADARQPVRQDACEVLLKLLAALGADSVIPRMARFWTHRNWKVRHGILQTIAEATQNNIPRLMNHKDMIITQVINLVEDPNEAVRSASFDCLEEIYRVIGSELTENLNKQSIRAPLFRDLLVRLNSIAPCNISLPEPSTSTGSAPGVKRRTTQEWETTAVSSRKPDGSEASADGVVKVDLVGSLKRPSSSSGSKRDDAPILITSEKELALELEAMTTLLSSLIPDWQQRIAAMARLEGIAAGSPLLLDCLNEMMKTGLRGSLIKQIEDRRSAVEKQACHTLTVLAALLGTKFTDHAIHFLPVLFRVLPITVQIMAESADACCQALIKSCASHRLMPVMVLATTKEKNSKIRGLCCGYIALMMEHWDVQLCIRCAEDFEGIIRSASSDSSSEARQAAKRTYMAFAAKAPEHAAVVLARLDPGVRDKLFKGLGANDRKGAAPPRPRVAVSARKPSAAFSSSAKASSDVLLYVPTQRPASQPKPQLPHHQQPPATPAPAAVPAAGAPAAAAPGSHQRPPMQPAQRGIPSTAHLQAMSATAPVPATTAGVQNLPPQRTFSADVPTAVVTNPPLSQRGSYSRASCAAELPPMSSRLQTAGAGRKSLGLGPMRVLGLADQGVADSAPNYVHMQLQGTLGSDPAADTRPKARRSSTGMGGIMALGASSLIHSGAQPVATAMRVPNGGGAGFAPHAPSNPEVATHVSMPSPSMPEASSATGPPPPPQPGSSPARRVSAADAMFGSGAMAPAGGAAATRSPRRSNSSWGGSCTSSAGPAAPAPVQAPLVSGPHTAATLGPGVLHTSAKLSVSKIVAGLLAAPKSWSDKVEALSSVAALLQQAADTLGDSGRDQCGDFGRDLERLVPKLTECIEDSHHKVVAAALDVMRAAVRSCPRALDASLERLMPPLFQRTADPRDATRTLATGILAECAQSYPADVLLAGLSRSLDSSKLPRVRVAVLEYACCHLGHGRQAGAPSNGNQVKQWLRLLCVLLSDKTHELRRAATEAAESLYVLVDPTLVSAYASYATGPEALALRRVINGIHDRDAMVIDSPTAAAQQQPVIRCQERPSPPQQLPGSPADLQVAGVRNLAMPAACSPLPKYESGQYASPMRVDMPPQASESFAGMPSTRLPSSAFPGSAAELAAANRSSSASSLHGAADSYQQRHQSSNMVSSAATTAGAFAAGLDPAAATRQVSLLVHRLQQAAASGVTAGQLAECYERLSECALSSPASAWQASSAAVAAAVASGVSGGSTGTGEVAVVREAALRLARALAGCQPALMQRVLDVVVPSLLAAASDGCKEIAKAAADTLTLIMDTTPALKAIDMLVSQLLMSDASPGGGRTTDTIDPDLLFVVVRSLHGVVRAMPADELASPGCLPRLAPGLVRSLYHTRADVRKAAVFCLVEVWCKLGDGPLLAQHLVGMSEAQHKLMAIYCKRAAHSGGGSTEVA